MTNRSLRILALGAALLAPALTGPSTASAQTTQGPAQSATADAAALARSRDMFQQANKLYDEGKYPQAEQLYLQAWKIKKSYDVAGNFGNLEADMNKPRAAAEYLSYALREFPAGGRPPLREALGKRLAEVSRMVGQLRITVNKPGADVLVDGQPAGSSPLAGEIYVDAGPHSVEARMEGFPPVIVNVTAQKGKSEQVALTFVPPPGASKVVIGVGAAVAGAGVIAGAVLLGIGASKGGTISDLQAKVKTTGCPTDQTKATGTCADLRDALDSRSTLGSAGLWTLVGGGVVGIGTLVYGLAGGGSVKSGKTGLTVIPVTDGQGGGVLVRGAF